MTFRLCRQQRSTLPSEDNRSLSKSSYGKSYALHDPTHQLISLCRKNQSCRVLARSRNGSLTQIAWFSQKLAEGGQIHASAAAADVNELANVGSATVRGAGRDEREERKSGEESVRQPVRDEL
jgi:hypothetical protein